MQRVNEAVREVVGSSIADDLDDPRIGFVTVTGADVSPDLRRARIFVSVLGDEKERERTLAALDSSHGLIQSRIAAELRLKNTPTLSFDYDSSVEQGLRIERLLQKRQDWSNQVKKSTE